MENVLRLTKSIVKLHPLFNLFTSYQHIILQQRINNYVVTSEVQINAATRMRTTGFSHRIRINLLNYISLIPNTYGGH